MTGRPLDRRAFLARPIAHRGLHDRAAGRIENTAPAFEAAIAAGFGIECDLRPAAGGTPVVFHDRTLARLIDHPGAVSELSVHRLSTLRYRDSDAAVLPFADLLDLVAGRVPVFAEIKSEWKLPEVEFLAQVARVALDYRGPLALMSFDPDQMAVLRELATEIPRGIVSGGYGLEAGKPWWPENLDVARAARLADLLESAPAAPSFYAYEVAALPTPVTRYVRSVPELPVLAWTVRTAEDWSRARDHADAAIFETCHAPEAD